MTPHYPPLANGAYRVGDPPQPLPDPVAGPPRPSWENPTSAAPPAEQWPQYPSPPPPPAQPGSASSRLPWVLAGVGLLAVVVVALGVVSVLASRTGGPSTSSRSPLSAGGPLLRTEKFAVDGVLTLESTPGQPVRARAGSCVVPSGLADMRSGATVELYDSDGHPLSADRMSFRSGTSSTCEFSFRLTDVPAGLSGYTLTVAAHDSVDYTEAELREGISLTVRSR